MNEARRRELLKRIGVQRVLKRGTPKCLIPDRKEARGEEVLRGLGGQSLEGHNLKNKQARKDVSTPQRDRNLCIE